MKRVAVYDVLWEQFQDQTVDSMADGADVLALIWERAWLAGDGDAQFNNASLGPRDFDALRAIYETKQFARAHGLQDQTRSWQVWLSHKRIDARKLRTAVFDVKTAVPSG